jgi:hypothetical protein
MREGDGQNIISRGLDGADTDKNQRESPDEFCKARAKFFHADMQSNSSGCDNRVLRRLAELNLSFGVIGVFLAQLPRDSLRLLRLARFLVSKRGFL